MSTSSRDFYRMTEDQFLDLYDFLGIPPVSPPNLIYLAASKIERHERYSENAPENNAEEISHHLAIARDKLLDTTAKRQAYEEEWESYYFPTDGYQTDVEKLCERNAQSRLLGGRLRQKNRPWIEEQEEEKFDYSKDFLFFVMKEMPNERSIHLLNPRQQIHLTPLEDVIFFEERQFFLNSEGKVRIEVGNDALGKSISIRGKSANLPLHIGDRIEFTNGARLILRSFYSGYRNALEGSKRAACREYAFYFSREDVMITLDPKKVYIFGRNTSDIHHLPLEEDLFCFVNIGRRERSVSRQNFQVFYHHDNWYIQDLGSRYGTTLDLREHFRFETLAGGGIMQLEPGRVRLGYDKSYIIEIDTVEECEKKRHSRPETSGVQEAAISVYGLPLL